MDGNPLHASRYRADIDGLRGVAVLVVVAFHAGVAGMGGGYVGVDVFFVLSGFLISGLLFQELEETRRISFRQFYARRIRRLLPASSLVLLSTLLLGLLVYSPIEMKRMSLSASSAALYVSNIFFANRSTVYLDQTLSTDPVLHTWSLSVEEQFYVLWPLVILLAACIGRRWWNAQRAIAGAMVLLFVTSFALCICLTHESQPLAFFVSVPRFWEFAAGGLAAMVSAVGFLSRRQREIVGALGLVLIGSAVLTYDDRSTFPGHLALLPVVGTALVLLAGGSDGAPLVTRLLARSGLVWLGRRSYSWYLWHWPVLVFARVLWPGLHTAGKVLAMVGALVLADLTLRLLENPIRYSHWLRRRPSLCLGGALAATALCFGAAHATQRSAVRQLSSAPQAPILAASRDLPDINKRRCVLRFRVRWPKAGCSFATPHPTPASFSLATRMPASTSLQWKRSPSPAVGDSTST